jgi:hypothetical protein
VKWLLSPQKRRSKEIIVAEARCAYLCRTQRIIQTIFTACLFTKQGRLSCLGISFDWIKFTRDEFSKKQVNENGFGALVIDNDPIENIANSTVKKKYWT